MASLTIASIGSIVMYKTIKTKEQEDINASHWEKKMLVFNEAALDSMSIVFLGNSLTERFDLSVFGNDKLVNRGIGGDVTEGILFRLDELIETKPKKIFIEIGINDLIKGESVSSVLKNYEKIIQRIKTESPKTELYIQSLLPLDLPFSIFTSGEQLNKNINEVNGELKNLCVQYQINYIDLHSAFILNDKLNPDYSLDGIHLSDEGYRTWKKLIENSIIE